VLRLGIAVLVTLLVAELSVRAIASRLPEPLTWYHPVAQIKVEQMEVLARSGARVEIVLAGTSQMAIAGDPLRFSQLVDGHPSTYNAALLAGYPSANHRFLPEEVVPRLHPKTIVYGLSSQDVQGGTEAPYDQALAVAPGVLGDLDRWLSQRSELVRHRQDLRDPSNLTYALTVGDGGGQLAFYRTSIIGADGGWKAEPVHSCRPGAEARSAPPETPLPFVPDEGRIATIWSTVDDLRASGVDVVIAVMPFADCYFHYNNAADNDRAGRELIARGARERGLLVVDVAADVHTDDLFLDPGHVNADGARRYTELLAAAVNARGTR
jgi:hypothetical protein